MKLPAFRLPPSTGQRADFYELLAGFTADGIPTYDALTEIDQQYRRFRSPMAPVTGRLLRRMRGGEGPARSCGAALQGLVPVVEALAVSSGEDAGDIPQGLRRAAAVARVNQEIVQTIRSELSYPLLLLVLLAGLLLVISFYVVPAMTEVIGEERWPTSARLAASFARAAPWLVLAGTLLLAGGTVLFLMLRSRWTGRFRDLLDRFVFPWTMHRRVTAAMLLASLASLLRIGVPFSHALERLAAASGAWERVHIQRVRARLRRGEREGAALAGPLFDDELRWQIQLYGRMSRFSEALDAFSERSLSHTRARIRSGFATIRIGLLIAVAGIIYWIYSAVLAVTLAARS
ncbi:type II secretory pathway component PulF [Tepidamorphus gemmatus]|uniref:Type II secretory pathway component PulF n=1 Tax=Tepidamorphus gemmatus TaxID=747076 RepID=A0A4V2UZC1_9HYPH|nr:type II secretion system F family protein [Tepidamorphus gemmatus]TCT10728.1 type II secretory pathway component PulF [Tepidamorphus gemmatus]